MQNKLLSFLVPIILVFALINQGSAQSQTQPETDTTIACILRTEIMILDIQVMNRRTGEIVDNLRHNDFEIFEDGVKQGIVMMRIDQDSPSIVFLIDANLKALNRDEKFAEHFVKAAQSFGIDSEIAIIGPHKATILPLQQFTSDHKGLSERLNSLIKNSPNSVPEKSINGMIQSGVIQMKKTSEGRGSKVLVVISEEPLSLAKDNKTLQALYETNYIVYGMIVSDESRGYSGNSALNLYAENTGGEIIYTNTNKLTEQIKQLAGRIRLRYFLGYEPANLIRDGAFRYVRVGLTSEKKKELGDVVIKTRLGYYAPTVDKK